MAEERVVGIDLGTTNSLVAYMEGDRPVVIPGEDGASLVPSIVALDEAGQIMVGNAARKYLMIHIADTGPPEAAARDAVKIHPPLDVAHQQCYPTGRNAEQQGNHPFVRALSPARRRNPRAPQADAENKRREDNGKGLE